MKKLVLLLTICLLFVGCGAKEETVTVTETVAETETVTGTVISPLPATIDVNALENCTVAVSFNEGDFFVNEAGETQLKATVYDYDLYDMVDIANLKKGDTIMIQGTEVVVESMETLESGLLFINGGMENGGYDLWHNESGVYFEHGFNDAKAYKAIGEVTLKVSENFALVDSSNPDKGDVTYTAADILKEGSEVVYNFNANNTSIVIENGEVTRMNLTYTP